MAVTVLIDRSTRDIIHDQVGQTLFRGAAIQQLNDVRMVQLGEGLSLIAEAAQQVIAVQLRQQNLDGHLLLILFIGSGSQINGGHAAPPNPLDDFVRSNAAANHRVFYREMPLRCSHRSHFGRFTFRSSQQGLDFAAKRFIGCACLLKKVDAFRRHALLGVGKHFLDLLPTLWCERGVRCSVWRRTGWPFVGRVHNRNSAENSA